MAVQSNDRLVRILKSCATAAGLGVFLLGVASLLAWIFLGVDALKPVLNGLLTVKANTALALVFSGASLSLLAGNPGQGWKRSMGRTSAGAALLIGVLSLTESLFLWNLHIDQLLFRDPSGGPSPGRMAGIVALRFLLLGLALLAIDVDVETRSRWRPAEWLALSTGFISMLALGAYVYGVRALQGISGSINVSLPTALGLMALCAGVLMARPEGGLMKVFSNDGFGGQMARRLLPTALILPFVLGWLRVVGQERGVFGAEFGWALYTVALTVLLVILVWWNASSLERSHRAREQVEAEILRLNQELEQRVTQRTLQLGTLNQKLEAEVAARQRTELKFRGLLEAAPDAIVVANLEGKIVLLNAQAENLFGYQRDELLGQPLVMLVPEHYREQHSRNLFGQPRLQSTRAGLEMYGLRKDGTELPVEISLSPLQTEEEELVSSAIRDITKHKLAEELLQSQAVALFEQASLLDVAHDAILVRDVNGVISFWNRGAETTYGWSKAEAIGQVSSVLLQTRFPDSWEQVETELLKEGRWEGELGHTKRDGSRIIVSSRWVLQRDQQGAAVRTLEINNDITARKRTEAEILKLNIGLEGRNVELAAANQELEAFTYSIAHDLRAPLRHIQAFSRMLIEEAGPHIPPVAREFVHDIVSSAEEMGWMVDDLLGLARVGRQDLRLQVTGLDSLVQEVVKNLALETGDREIRWQIGELPFADCDPGLMKKVFSNLLSNAVKYTRKRKPAVIEVGRIMEQGENVIFVRDNGVGFSMKYADKLFGVFQRLHRKEDFEGTGVGLATVQRIIHKHGGRIWADAELDKGATFYFTYGPLQGKEHKDQSIMAAGGK